MQWLNYILRGTRNLSIVSIKFRLFDEKPKKNNLIKFDEIEFKRKSPLRKHPHMFYTPSFTLLYSRKGEMRGTQNEGLFSGLD